MEVRSLRKMLKKPHSAQGSHRFCLENDLSFPNLRSTQEDS